LISDKAMQQMTHEKLLVRAPPNARFWRLPKNPGARQGPRAILGQLAGDLAEHGVEFAAKRGHGANDGDGKQARNEAIFGSRDARLIVDKAMEQSTFDLNYEHSHQIYLDRDHFETKCSWSSISSFYRIFLTRTFYPLPIIKCFWPAKASPSLLSSNARGS
jgi:hypothetical protein